MKGIIMEKTKTHIVVMKSDGTFINMKNNKNADIGEEIDIKEKVVKYNKFYRYVSAAVASIIVLVGGINVKAYYTPYSYMNIDINPSIQLELNKFDRVLDANALNEDGETVLSDLESIKNLKVEDATEDIVEVAYKRNYIKEDDENNVMVALYNPDKEKRERIEQRVDKSINEFIQRKSRKITLLHEIVSKRDLEKAKINRMSVGKLIMLEKVQKVDPNITLEEVKTMSVRDIVKLIDKGKKEGKLDNEDMKDIKDALRNEKDEIRKPRLPENPNFNNNINDPNRPQIKRPQFESPNIDRTFMNKNDFENRQNEINEKMQILKPPREPRENSGEQLERIKERIGEISNKLEIN